VLPAISAVASPPAPPSVASTSPIPLWQSPVGPTDRPAVLHGFDPPARRWLSGHRGVDLAATTGHLVRAAGPGEVTHASRIADRGVVVVTHGALRTTYEPVDASVVRGSRVLGGDALGVVGTGGHCSARCVHWGLRRGEEYLDPLLLLNRAPPVLKSPGTRLIPRSLDSESPQSESARSMMRPLTPAARTPDVRLPDPPLSADTQIQQSRRTLESPAAAAGARQSTGSGLVAAAVAIGTALGVRSIVKRR